MTSGHTGHKDHRGARGERGFRGVRTDERTDIGELRQMECEFGWIGELQSAKNLRLVSSSTIDDIKYTALHVCVQHRFSRLQDI